MERRPQSPGQGISPPITEPEASLPCSSIIIIIIIIAVVAGCRRHQL
jgi:hypothetical protein